MSIEIVSIDPACAEQRGRWRDFTAAHPQSTLHHELPWIDAILATFPHRPHLLMALQGREVAGVFPAFEVHSVLAGTLIVSMPYGIYGGVLSEDQAAADALLSRMQDVGRRSHARCLDLRSRDAHFAELSPNDRYVVFTKNIPESSDAVWRSFPRKARAEARRARDRFGLRACFDDAGAATVWSLYSRSMRRLGSPNMPRRFFETLARGLDDQHLWSVVWQKDKPIAGLLSFVHRDTILPYYSGFDDRAWGCGANNYLYLTLMERARELGLKRFDFGRTRRDNTGALAFKKNQGFEPRPLEYQVDVPAGRSQPNLTPTNRRFQLAQWAWKRMPLAFTRPVGAWLSASIPG